MPFFVFSGFWSLMACFSAWYHLPRPMWNCLAAGTVTFLIGRCFDKMPNETET